MWKDRVWATDIKISAAANFLQTDIYTYTEIPGKNTTLPWIKFPASCSCDDEQPDYSAIYLYWKPLRLRPVSDIHLEHTCRTDWYYIEAWGHPISKQNDQGSKYFETERPGGQKLGRWFDFVTAATYHHAVILNINNPKTQLIITY